MDEGRHGPSPDLLGKTSTAVNISVETDHAALAHTARHRSQGQPPGLKRTKARGGRHATCPLLNAAQVCMDVGVLISSIRGCTCLRRLLPGTSRLRHTLHMNGFCVVRPRKPFCSRPTLCVSSKCISMVDCGDGGWDSGGGG